MFSMQADLNHLRRELKAGSIARAYRALLGYMLALRTHFQKRFPKYSVSGLYPGTMDMTYFAVVPPSLKKRGLKVAIVFNYSAFRFEAWLSGRNRQVQRKYWELLRDNPPAEVRVATPAKGVDSILERDLAEDFDFGDLDRLDATLTQKVVKFIADVEGALSRR